MLNKDLYIRFVHHITHFLKFNNSDPESQGRLTRRLNVCLDCEEFTGGGCSLHGCKMKCMVKKLTDRHEFCEKHEVR